ncbi:hypothetical protein ACHAXA_004668 [Cyclostephanos tholiformis]|uniref:Methionyl-tRNA formyltransferase, mitochondrial n=1 Tax=Cyclostephanos tholiformis TaxID=382380 RepID=A0ABD3R938_9STRA
MKTSTSTNHLASIVVALFSAMACCALLRPCRGFQSTVVGTTRRGCLRSAPPSSISPRPVRVAYPRRIHPYSSRAASSEDDEEEEEEEEENKARILFLGTPDVAAASLESIHEASRRPGSPYRLVGVVTQPPKRRKRGGKETPSPVGIVAERLGLRVLCPEKARDGDFLDELENEVRPDLCITAAYGQYLPRRFLSLPRFGTLNIHPSLLPRWRGSSPVQRSLEAGDETVGVTVLFTVSRMDAGPIIVQESLTIDANEQATTLLPRLFEIGTKRLIDAIPSVIDGGITMETATVQDDSLVREAGMIDSSEGQLWPSNMTAIQCHNRVRGFSMWPGTFLYVRMSDDDDENEPMKVKIIESRVLDETAEPTNLIEIGPRKGDGLRLVCADGSVLELLRVQPATRNIMDAKSFVNGLQGRTVRWLSESESRMDPQIQPGQQML